MRGTPEIRIFQNPEEVAREAAEFFVWLAEQGSAAVGKFRVALSGGSTPQAMFSTLAKPPLTTLPKWQEIEFYFGDERCVPPDHPESNFRMADLSLFQPSQIQSERIFRMPGEVPDPNQGALDYERVLRRCFGVPAPGWPRFDLVLLGLGEDGHTASLFPDTAALDERERLVVANQAPRGVCNRLTFTVPLIDAAQVVLYLVCGLNKAPAVRAVLEGPYEPHRFPAQLVKPDNGRLLWFIDRAAASELSVARQQVVSHEE